MHQIRDDIKYMQDRTTDNTSIEVFLHEGKVDRDHLIYWKYSLKLRKKKRKPRTTDSRHSLPTYPNIHKN